MSQSQNTDSLPPKSMDELGFWLPIARNGFRGFSREEWRDAAVHYKQYGLISIGRDISFLRDKTVFELCCGPSPIIRRCGAVRAIGVDPLCAVYSTLWDLSRDNVEYVTSEIETFVTDVKADVVICWNGIDHVRDVEATIRKVRELLKEGGEFWSFTNLEDHSKSRHYKRSPDPGSQHQYHFNRVSLDRLFRTHGFVWVTQSLYVPIQGNVYPEPGMGGVLRQSSNPSVSAIRHVIKRIGERLAWLPSLR